MGWTIYSFSNLSVNLLHDALHCHKLGSWNWAVIISRMKELLLSEQGTLK